MRAVIVGRHAPFPIVILAHQLMDGVDPGTPFWLRTRHVIHLRSTFAIARP